MINKIARLFDKWIQMGLAIVISILLLQENSDGSLKHETTITLLWILFIILSSIYTINGLMLKFGFNKEVKAFLKAGKPIRGIVGFDELVISLKKAQNQSYIITISSILSFILYFYVIILGNKIYNIGSTLAIAMAFVAISVMFLVSYPEDPSLTPGGLVGFYEPDVFPLTLDNILSDVFLTYLDPVTFMKFDDWSIGVQNMLIPEFENDEDDETRLERAREKILLLAYLSFSNSEAFTRDVIYKELVELIGDENLKSFLKGKLPGEEGTDIGLTWKEIVGVVKRISRRAPEPFNLVDRLMVELTDNYSNFVKNDLYFTVSAKANQGSVRESTGMIVFFINKSKKEDRDFKVWYKTDVVGMHPSTQEANLTLDILTDPFPEKEPKLISDGDEIDILTLLSSLLQVGDAIWFRVQPSGFGRRLVAIYAEEEANEGDRSPTLGASVEMKFTKSLTWYIKAYIPKLSGLIGVALPTIKAIIGVGT